MDRKPSFFSGLGRSFLVNSPLLVGAVLLFVIGFFTTRILKIVGISLFICYILSCLFESVYSVSSKSLLRRGPDSPEADDASEAPSDAAGTGNGDPAPCGSAPAAPSESGVTSPDRPSDGAAPDTQ